MKNVNRSADGRWLKGTPPPNPAGRPLAARQRISEKLLADLADVWEAHGNSVLERLARTEPGKLAQAATNNTGRKQVPAIAAAMIRNAGGPDGET
jgi:hypothetical protein